MKSVDELRKAADEIAGAAVPCGASPDYIVVRRKIDKLADAIERELEENYVKLPLDDDGEPWRIGDLAQSKRHPQYPVSTVCGTGVIGGKPALFYLSRNGLHVSEYHQGWDYAESVRHHQTDTFERIIEDVAKAVADTVSAWNMHCTTNDTLSLHPYIDRCKALAGEDK